MGMNLEFFVDVDWGSAIVKGKKGNSKEDYFRHSSDSGELN